MSEKLKEEVDKALEVLRNGGIILYPTDTVWGIGCDATNADAVENIYKLKQREDSKSMIVLLDSINNIPLYVDNTPYVAWELFELSEKPLTLILPKAKKVAINLVPEEGFLGIRVPKHEFCTALIRKLGRPLVSTSANISGENTPVSYEDIDARIIDGVDYVVSRAFERGMTKKPSSIIKLSESSEVTIIRE